MKNKILNSNIITAIILLLFASGSSFALQTPQDPAATGANAAAINRIIDQMLLREKALMSDLRNYSPLVETYIQTLTRDKDLGAVPTKDTYFLGKLDMTEGISERSLTAAPGWASGFKGFFTQVYSVQFMPNGFIQAIVVDTRGFDRANYDFQFVRKEFLGEVRTLVFEVRAKQDAGAGRFSGRVWVEDRDYNIVRFNGAYGPSDASRMYFHFDSWRENMAPGKWLPSYVYTEESDMKYFLGRRKLHFKAQTRLWGYNVGKPEQFNEMTALIVESESVKDGGNAVEDSSPVQNFRTWERQAEDNVVLRMQKAGLIAPDGELNKVIETVITNLEVTNNISIEPPVRARVLLTAPLESFTIGHTIVLSRGLIDVLPDEASLAMVLAHELAHIAKGHRLDTKYAFHDRMQFSDEDTFRALQNIKRDEDEEVEADKVAAEYLANSPYKNKLANAGLFLKAVDANAKALSGLLHPHMGNHIADGEVSRMASLMQIAPNLEPTNVDQIAALPLGGRLKLFPWNNKVELNKARPVALMDAREKLQFELTPVFLYLQRHGAASTTPQQTSLTEPEAAPTPAAAPGANQQ